jgi:hypothetical protein
VGRRRKRGKGERESGPGLKRKKGEKELYSNIFEFEFKI